MLPGSFDETTSLIIYKATRGSYEERRTQRARYDRLLWGNPRFKAFRRANHGYLHNSNESRKSTVTQRDRSNLPPWVSLTKYYTPGGA